MMRMIISCVVILFSAICLRAAPPNIIFMLSDDQSWNGLSVAMLDGVKGATDPYAQTPRLAELAAAGMKFSAAYAPASVCSPTRMSLLTGKSAARTGWTKAGPSMTAKDNYRLVPPKTSKHVSADEQTIAELLRGAGYATAHYGKWHLGSGGPEEHGYDESDGNIGNEAAYKYKDPNPVDLFGMAARAERFMAKSQAAGKPFFIQLSWHALHAPDNALASTVAKYKKQYPTIRGRTLGRSALAEDMDTAVGRVVDAVDRLKLADNTYIICMSDNGGARNGPLRGGKGSVWEGGIRVPMIVKGPGVAPGSVCHTRVVGTDWFPTFLAWAGINHPPADIEGGSLAELLASGGEAPVQRPREELVFHFPHYQGGDGPHTALILGDLKLMKFYETDTLALFDLAEDLGEANDLADMRPDVASDLHNRMRAYLTAVDAKLPIPNTSYDASKPSSGRHASRPPRGGSASKRGQRRK